MSPYERLFQPGHAFDHPVTVGVAAALVALLTLAPVVLFLLSRSGISSEQISRFWIRWKTWLVMAPLVIAPILLGAAWTILGVGLLSLLCYREYARATGLFREKLISLTIVVSILLVTFATLDNWYRLFMALTPISIVLILTVALFPDRPQGYIQRTALAVLGFVLFGHGLGHLGHLANDADYRPLILLVLVAAETNHFVTYLMGKSLRQRPLYPNSCSKVTGAGTLCSLVVTTAVVVGLGRSVFAGTVLSAWHHLLTLGILISVVGLLGVLIFASIKRDLGIKDFDVTVPGHGGLLDRFDSLVPIASVVFHYVNYFVGVGADQSVRIWTTVG